MDSSSKLAVGVAAAACLIAACGMWMQSQRISALSEEVERLSETVEATQSRVENVAVAAGSRPAAGDSLEIALKDLGASDVVARYSAARVVKLHGDVAVPWLLDIIEKNDDSSAAKTALVILADMQPEPALPRLRKVAKAHADVEVRGGALGVLARYRDKASIPDFIAAISAKDQELKVAGVMGARRTDATAALGPLLAAANSEEDVLAREIKRAVLHLAEVNPQEFQATLNELPPTHRFAAVPLLAASQEPSSRKLLSDLIDDKDARVSLAAARVMSRLGDPGAVAAVKRHAASSDVQVKQIADEILKNLR